MARHSEIMENFKENLENFDYQNSEDLTAVITGYTLAHALAYILHVMCLLST